MAKKLDIKNMNKEEMKKKMAELKMELMKLKSQVSRGTPPENPGRIRSIKRTIARMLTFMNQKTGGAK